MEFVTKEAVPDDIITLEFSKISEDSKTGFRLTSKQEVVYDHSADTWVPVIKV